MFRTSTGKAALTRARRPANRAAAASPAAPLQRLADSSPHVRLLNRLQRFADTGRAALQRQVYLGGGGAAVTTAAKSAAKRARLPKNHVNGSKHVPQIPGKEYLMGYKFGGKYYVGGMVFNNNAMPDTNKLPYINGQTYQEWDVNPVVADQGRDAERVVTGSDGKDYYSSDHYKNFTLIR